MTPSCPVPTPAERRYGEILDHAVAAMIRRVEDALEETLVEVRAAIEGAGLEMPPPPRDHLVSILDQRLFCMLCGADPETFAGGNPGTALAVIANKQNIARHYWGAAVAPASQG